MKKEPFGVPLCSFPGSGSSRRLNISKSAALLCSSFRVALVVKL